MIVKAATQLVKGKGVVPHSLGRRFAFEDSPEASRLALQLGRDVALHVGRRAEVRVAEHFLADLHRDARGQEVGRGRVPEIVEPDPRQARSGQVSVEPMRDR